MQHVLIAEVAFNGQVFGDRTGGEYQFQWQVDVAPGFYIVSDDGRQGVCASRRRHA